MRQIKDERMQGKDRADKRLPYLLRTTELKGNQLKVGFISSNMPGVKVKE